MRNLCCKIYTSDLHREKKTFICTCINIFHTKLIQNSRLLQKNCQKEFLKQYFLLCIAIVPLNTVIGNYTHRCAWLAAAPVNHSASQFWSRMKMWSRAKLSWGRSSARAGYMLAQWAVPERDQSQWDSAQHRNKWRWDRPLMKTARRSLVMSWVTPRACQGSMEPLGKTIRVVLMSYPPYSSLVCWIASSNEVLRL